MSRAHGFTTSKRYAALRRFVLDRDKWRCQKCGRPSALELHHLRPLASGGKVWDPANCQTLCRSCHITLTGRGNRRQPTGRSFDGRPLSMRWPMQVPIDKGHALTHI